LINGQAKPGDLAKELPGGNVRSPVALMNLMRLEVLPVYLDGGNREYFFPRMSKQYGVSVVEVANFHDHTLGRNLQSRFE
jgi:hypothetical protein